MDYRGEERRRPSVNGLPWWIQATSVLGFPVVVSMILLGIFTGLVPSPVTEARDMLKSHMQGEVERTRLLRIMCRHSAVAQRQNPDDCDR